MLIMRESIWFLMATGGLGFYLGYLKGMARWGLLLGLLLGPIGWGIILILPSRLAGRRRHGGASGPFRPSGRSGPSDPSGSAQEPFTASAPTCPRCGKTVGRSDKACGHCGNVLMPIRYRVTGPVG